MIFEKGQKVSFMLGIGRKEGVVVGVNSKTVWIRSEEGGKAPLEIKRHVIKHQVELAS